MPQYVYIAYAVAALTLPFALWGPPPRGSSQRRADVCFALMVIAIAVLATSLLMPFFDVWFGAIAGAGASLVLFHLMFWAARDRGDEDGGDDGSGGGGGGGPRTPPQGPAGPSGIDWDEFDRYRTRWEHRPQAPDQRGGDREPALV